MVLNTLDKLIEGHMKSDMSWSIRVKERIKDLRVSQLEVAKLIQVSEQALSHYLTGKRPIKLRKFFDLANVLNCDVGWLLTGRINTNSRIDAKVLRKAEQQVDEIIDNQSIDIDPDTRIQTVIFSYTEQMEGRQPVEETLINVLTCVKR